MSVSSLPEWKQLLLERKRREEEERERREKQEEEKLASMPAWKRGIIQRRKAKQDGLGDREKERDLCLLQVDVRPPSDCLSDTDSFVTVNLGSDLSISPDPGQWLDADLRPASQVSLETIVPVHENPFIRTQSSWRRGKDSEIISDPEVKEPVRGRDIELKIERFRDLSEGRERESRRERRERENSREGWERDKSPWKESVKDAGREREFLKGRKDEEEKETDPSSPYSPVVPCLRTIRADNIIIIEQERKGSDERRGRWRETERERSEEEGKRALKMDLGQILAGGGSVTEIRASEVLIIKPSPTPEERSPMGGGGGGGGSKGSGREDGEMKGSTDGRRESTGRELRGDLSWLREKEKERPWGHATVIKDDRKDSLEDNVFVDRGGRVSQLLSKFGEHPKPPSRSKSSDNFLRPGRRKLSGDEDDQEAEADGKNAVSKGVPKRSFSFSDRVVGGRENGLEDNGYYERTTRDRIHSEKSSREVTAKIKMGCARLLDKDRFGKQRERQLKNEDETTGFQPHRSQIRNPEPMDVRPDDGEGDEGFTVASVKNTEGISFARRVPIRQDGKTRAEREAKRLTGEREAERQLSVEKDSEAAGQIEVSDLWIEDGFESTIPPESMQQSFDMASLCSMAESQYRHESAFQECSSLLCPVTDRTLRGAEWSGTGPQGPYLTHSVLSQHTVDLISKIEKIGDTTVYSNERGERAYKAVYEETKESDLETQMYGNTRAETLSYDMPRSPKRIPPMGIHPGPLEIQIPRTVFYVAEDMVEKKKAVDESGEAQDWEDSKGLERRDSWRIGKPLSRIESLREKIRQRELERLKQREVEGGGGGEGAEINVTQTSSDDDRASEAEAELEAAAQTRKRSSEAEGEQEDAAAPTSVAAFDVTQEVGVLKTCPQLPVAVPHSQAVREEVASPEVISDGFQISEDEDDPVRHVEEQLRRHRAQHENREDAEEEKEEEEEGKEKEEEVEEFSEEELEGFTSPLDPETPHPNSLTAMSRIYKLETVSSRSGLCMRDKAVDLPSVHLVKVKPLTQQADGKALPGGEVGAVQTIQRQIEQLQLKEQETLRPCTSPKRGQQNPKSLLKHQVKDNGKTQEKDHEASDPEVASQRVCSPTSQLKPSNQTITVTPAANRSQSPDNALKPSDCAPTPASSPCSPSPAPSPIVSPSSTPSPPLFSIRSASGGKGKRGATITITPRKTVVAGGGGGGGGGGTVSIVGSTTTKISPQQPQTTSTSAEPGKKKYPTAEEIEVIGGYQSLEKSCLMKNRGTPKRGNVCFDEEQLEQVCEYPSEASMLAYTLYPHDVWRLQGEEAEKAETEGGSIVSKSAKSIENVTRRSLKVDESCPR